VEALLAWLCQRGEAWHDAFAEGRIRVTVNQQFAEPCTWVENGDEVVLAPRPT
jgi:molybdopterin converting factor small subunit